MNKILFMFFAVFSFLPTLIFASPAAGSDPKPVKIKSNYDKAVESVKWAKKYEKKGK